MQFWKTFKGFFINRDKRKTLDGVLTNAIEIANAKNQDGDYIKIVPIGYFPEHHNGAHRIEKHHIEQMADNFKNSGTDLLFDYEHNSLWGDTKAAGWSDAVEAREDGLYAKYPSFTNAAEDEVKGRVYRYFSPVYRLNTKNKLGHEIGATVDSVALTNRPYMDTEIEHIRNKEEIPSMDPKLLAFLGLPATATQADVDAKMNSLRKEHNLGAEATLEEILAAAKPKEDGGVVNSEEGDDTVQTLTARVEALEATSQKSAEQRAEDLVNAAIESGKILPAHKNAWLNSAKADFEQTKADLDALKPNSALPGTVKPTDNDGGDGKKVNSHDAATAAFRELRASAAA